VTVQGIASATPVLVAGTGTAGTPGTAVLAVQGVASGTAIPVSTTELGVAQGAAIASKVGPMVQTSTTTAAPTYTTATVNPLSTDTSGSLRVAIMSGVTADVAEDSPAGTSPALIGFQAATSEATAVAAADVIKARATLVGAPLSWGPALQGDTWQYSSRWLE